MYVYRVTHIPTGKFYIGLSNLPKSTFDAARDLDPYNQFEVYGDNGSRLKMINVEKRIIATAGDANELAHLGAESAKGAESDPNFLGLKGQQAPSPTPNTPSVTSKHSSASPTT